MAESYAVQVKIVSQGGTCPQGHKVGEEWVIERKTPRGMCISAFNALYSVVRVPSLGGAHPWSDNPDTAAVACPDAENPVVFETRRLRKTRRIIPSITDILKSGSIVLFSIPKKPGKVYNQRLS